MSDRLALLRLGLLLWPVIATAEPVAIELTPLKIEADATRLTAPDAATAREALARIPGAAAVVTADDWQDTPAVTLKDVLDFTPGVFVQPKWGEDSRLSIRGSGLARNFHLRGVQLYLDGIPLNTADGGADFQEIDPAAYRYVEVYKGANGLRFGANALGGAINLVTPSGYDAERLVARLDAGSFGHRRLRLSAAGAGDRSDGHLTVSRQQADGYRDHSDGDSTRLAASLGLRPHRDLETRFHLTLADIDQRIPGSVTRAAALRDPRAAAAANVALDYQRNMESWRLANRTVLRRGAGEYEAGLFYADKRLAHPIYQYLDHHYRDHGLFLRLTRSDRLLARDNRLTVGATLHRGDVDNRQYVNQPGGVRGALLSRSRDEAENHVLYLENALALTPALQLIAAIQYVDARREREDRLATPGSSGSGRWQAVNPRLGLLWQADDTVQVFANVSRSSEAPTFSELNFTAAGPGELEAQQATTWEIGTRGARGRLDWELALYHMALEDEFQYFDLGGGNYRVTNADRTVHRGVEAGARWHLVDDLLAPGDSLRLDLAWTLNDFRFDDDETWGDNRLPGVPRHYLRAGLDWQRAGFHAGPGVEWVPAGWYVDNANRHRTPDYALLGFRAGYERGDWAFHLDARNLTDRRYIASTSVAAVASDSSALYEPGTGRALYAGVRVRLP